MNLLGIAEFKIEPNVGDRLASVARLEPNVVHVWRLALEADPDRVQALEPLLSPAEWEQAGRFYFAPHRRRFVVRRAMRRMILGAHLGQEPGDVKFTTDAHGKPELAGQAGAGGLRFSATHSGELGLVAVVSERQVGIDLETHRPLDESLEAVARCFSAQEQKELAAVGVAERVRAFFDCWTRKEAFVKALGLGLAFPLDHFTVAVRPDQPAALVAVRGDPRAPARWTLHSLNAGKGCSAALVVGPF